MSPEIFAGLGKPKSQLYFDLQAYISVNGGRLHLANVLECELIKKPTYYRQKRCKKQFKFKHFTADEDELVRKHIIPKGRTVYAMHHRRWLLKQKGLL